MTTKRVKVTLAEVPAVNIEARRERLLEDFTLRHPKYAHLVLASNLQQRLGIAVDIADLKGGATEAVPYGNVDYGGEKLEFSRVGAPFDEYGEQLLNADVIAISANFTLERSIVAQTLGYLRGARGSRVIVVGGHDATADPEYYLRRGADLCVLGEGETALVEIVQAIAAGESPLVPGTACLRDGMLLRDARRPPNRFEDIVFPDAELLRRMPFEQSPDGPFPAGVTAPIAAFETSRGCPEACSFCDVSFVVGGYRPIPEHRLMEQVRAFERAGIRTLQVIDDNLLYRILPRYGGREGRDTILRLFTHLYDRGFAWEFFNGFQLALFEHDGKVDEELVAALYRNGWRGDRFVGCFRSYVPIDKVTDVEISLLRKLKPLDVATSVVGAIAACAVPMLVLGFVIGNARETRASLEETCEKAESFRDVVVRSSRGRTVPVVLPLCSVPLPGTPDFRNFSRHIAYSPDEYPELYNIFISVLHTEAFTPWELTEARQRMRNSLNGDGAPELNGSRIETRNA